MNKWCQFCFCFLIFIFVSSSFSLFLSLFPQSYALYITGDENATSTGVSKYLAKLSAGVCVYVNSLKDNFTCVLLTEPFDCVCVCVHLDIYWQPALITCQSHSSLLQGSVTHEEKWFVVTQVAHHLLFFFFYYLLLLQQTTQHSGEVTAVAAGIWSAPFPLT